MIFLDQRALSVRVKVAIGTPTVSPRFKRPYDVPECDGVRRRRRPHCPAAQLSAPPTTATELLPVIGCSLHARAGQEAAAGLLAGRGSAGWETVAVVLPQPAGNPKRRKRAMVDVQGM